MELRIQLRQLRIGLRIADQDDFGIRADRLRANCRDARRGAAGERLVLQLDASEAHHPLDGLPRARLRQDIMRLQAEIAADSLMHCARLEHHVIGEGQPLTRTHVDTPDQISVGRIRLLHYWRLLCGGARDHHIGAIAS
jgi:hypothetical protein